MQKYYFILKKINKMMHRIVFFIFLTNVRKSLTNGVKIATSDF